MKTKNTTDEIDFEYVGIIEEVEKQEKTVQVSLSKLWSLANKLENPPKPVKKFNKEEIQALEQAMKKEGKI